MLLSGYVYNSLCVFWLYVSSGYMYNDVTLLDDVGKRFASFDSLIDEWLYQRPTFFDYHTQPSLYDHVFRCLSSVVGVPHSVCMREYSSHT